MGDHDYQSRRDLLRLTIRAVKSAMDIERSAIYRHIEAATKLAAENERLRSALEHYADRANWRICPSNDFEASWDPSPDDNLPSNGWELAYQALSRDWDLANQTLPGGAP